jgi:hypothetical protein
VIFAGALRPAGKVVPHKSAVRIVPHDRCDCLLLGVAYSGLEG